MANNKSYVDLAYDVLVEKYNENGKSVPMAFNELLYAVGQNIYGHDDLTEGEQEELLKLASKFYTAITLDGHFVAKENNTWVLREHEKYEDIHIDMNKIYIDEDEEKDENVEKTEDEDGGYLIDEDEEKDDDNYGDDIPVTSGDTDDDDND